MKSKLLILLLTLSLPIIFPMVSFTQPPPPPPPPVDTQEEEPTQVPIDGGLSFLLAAGVGYGLKKARAKRK